MSSLATRDEVAQRENNTFERGSISCDKRAHSVAHLQIYL